MYDMTKKYFHHLLDGLHLVLVVDVCESVQHVPKVLKIISNRFLVKNYDEMMYDMTKKYFHHLLDGLHLVLLSTSVRVSNMSLRHSKSFFISWEVAELLFNIQICIALA